MAEEDGLRQSPLCYDFVTGRIDVSAVATAFCRRAMRSYRPDRARRLQRPNGQDDANGRPLAQFALGLDVAPVQFSDVFHDR